MKCKLTWPLCAALLLCFCFAQCKKHKETPKTELEKLPPITQTGANRFGCLVNGKAWVPENGGIIITNPPLRFYYDNLNGGEFSIRAEKIIASLNVEEYLNIGLQNCAGTETCNLDNTHQCSVGYNNYANPTTSCITLFSNDSDIQSSGFITITKFDLNAGIISGTFSFTLTKSGCSTINITDGRFDAKL